MGNSVHQQVNPNVQSTGFNQKWAINKIVLPFMSYVLNNTTYMNQLEFLFKNPSDFFVSLRAYPFDVSRYFYPEGFTPPTSRIKMSNIELKNKDDQFVQGMTFPTTTTYKHIGAFTIDRIYNNFMDFSPYTKLELYIPFCGFVTLDTNLVMGKELRLFLSVDWDSGACTVYIVKHESNQDPDDGDIIMSVNGQIGFEIPLGSSNANENAKQLLANGLTMTAGVVASAVMGNPLPMAMVLGTSTVGAFNALQERISKGGSVNGSNALVTPYNAYLIRTMIKPSCNQLDYASYKGLPLQSKESLLNIKGYTKCSGFHLENFSKATDSELQEIDSLLKSGVIL